MKRLGLALVFLLPCVARAQDFTGTDAFRAMCWQLLSHSHLGFSHIETAAFIVRDGDGYTCVPWPDDGFVDSVRWEGRFPADTVAIVHTHPNWMQSPSTIDARTARTSGIPVYVITRTRITRTDGGDAEVVLDGDWKPGPTSTPRRHSCG